MEELFLGRPFSNQETGDTPVAEGMITDAGTQAAVGHGDGAGDSGDDAMRSAQLSEDRDGASSSSGGDNDNNATGIGLQVLKQRKRARSLPIDTTTRTIGIPHPNTDRRLDGPHLAKRQKP